MRLFGILLVLGFLVALLSPPVTATLPQGNVWIDTRAVLAYGKWVAFDETPGSVIRTISGIHNATGRILNLYAIVGGPHTSGHELIQGSAMQLDRFLLRVQNASGGGQIIPTLNMNYYTSDLNLTINERSNYCDPHNVTICGPSWFYQVSSELLSLKVIQLDSNRTLNLDAWDQFNRDVMRAGLPTNTTLVILETLHAQGWVHILTKTAQYFDDGGLIDAQAVNINAFKQPPYLTPQLLICKLKPSNSCLVHFDRQNFNSPSQETNFAFFMRNLTSSQKAIGLTSLAANQSASHYTFIYPVFLFTSRDGIKYIWDVNHEKQHNGTKFIMLIEELIRTYN